MCFFTGIELGIPCCTSLLTYKYCVCLSVCLSVDSALFGKHCCTRRKNYKLSILYPGSDLSHNSPILKHIDQTTRTGLFQKKITFSVRKFQKFCVWFLTLYAFIISKVIIRTQNYTNASLISEPLVISYQNV